MSRYAVSDDGALVLTWPTPVGDHATVISRSDGDLDVLRGLAATLTSLSGALWRTYTHPPSATDDVEGEGWRREQSRESFADVVDAVTGGEHGDAPAMMSYDPVVEFAARVGRALSRLGDTTLTELVGADVEAEIAAVLAADVGDLGGRAAQALTLSRAEASPAQVAQAHRVFQDDPFGGERLLTDFEPSAASVAAAHWLRAAAEVTADLSGRSRLADVILEADDIQALVVETPMVVLDYLEDDVPPETVCSDLISEAMAVADGVGLYPDGLAEGLERFRRNAALRGTEFRLCALDPHRPAIDLLEDLVEGIFGCWLVFREHTDSPSSGSDPAEGDGTADEDEDERRVLAEQDELMTQFAALVRDRADGWQAT